MGSARNHVLLALLVVVCLPAKTPAQDRTSLHWSSSKSIPGSPEREKVNADEKTEPAVWYDESFSRWSFEFGTKMTAGAWFPDGMEHEATFLYGGSLRLGFRYQADLDDYHSGSNDWVSDCLFGIFHALWSYLKGNQYGADLRFHWFREGDRNRFLIGIQPLARFAFPSEDMARWRFPAGFSILVPEAGLVVNDQSDLGWYIQWVAPISVLLTRNVGLELRPVWGLVGEDEVRVFFGASLGIVVRG